MIITRINEFQAAIDKSDELHAYLLALIPYISASEGCISCEVLRSMDQVDVFVFIEKWESIAHHKKSIENFPKDDMQKAMHLFGAPPKGRYYHS